ncbi:MAG: PRC-barrel domain-containing protein [Patescibacteria group bacterium]
MQSNQKIIGLVVKTKTGQFLGHVKDLEIQTESFQVAKFIISPSAITKKILGDDLIIDSSQVIEINEKEIVVEDTLVGVRAVNEPISI